MSTRWGRATVKTPAIAAAALILGAGAAAVVPLPAAFVERVYSAGAYPVLQRVLTSFSNRVPFALIDVLVLAAALGEGRGPSQHKVRQVRAGQLLIENELS